MIEYQDHLAQINMFCSYRGSAFPKALCWAIPTAFVGLSVHFIAVETEAKLQNYVAMSVWTSYFLALAVLFVFRTHLAYSRFNSGAESIAQFRGRCSNTYNLALAYCSRAPELKPRVDAFRHAMARYMSLLHAAALKQLSLDGSGDLPILGIDGMSDKSLASLANCVDTAEMIVQWVHQSLMEAQLSGVLVAPILAPAQELSAGMIDLKRARNIRDVPFPWNFAQMLAVFLLGTTMTMPIFAGLCLDNGLMVVGMCLVVPTALWSLHYISQELEMPFGSDENDLPLYQIQERYNASLASLFQGEASAPAFDGAAVTKASFNAANTEFFDQVLSQFVVRGSAAAAYMAKERSSHNGATASLQQDEVRLGVSSAPEDVDLNPAMEYKGEEVESNEVESTEVMKKAVSKKKAVTKKTSSKAGGVVSSEESPAAATAAVAPAAPAVAAAGAAEGTVLRERSSPSAVPVRGPPTQSVPAPAPPEATLVGAAAPPVTTDVGKALAGVASNPFEAIDIAAASPPETNDAEESPGTKAQRRASLEDLYGQNWAQSLSQAAKPTTENESAPLMGNE
eukprot:TRINITY_DN10682_c0_g1_i1.p1 TRINITY_DN10682_c0_g1~~TRINITY_DN10682_c0_g1_i1.p1  ORF type:complete len:599 (+),score=123.34 TRINITY_DN10682_c0_g1_i1:97-1797(+)